MEYIKNEEAKRTAAGPNCSFNLMTRERSDNNRLTDLKLCTKEVPFRKGDLRKF